MSAEERLAALEAEVKALREAVLEEARHVESEIRRLDRVVMVLTGAIADK